MGQLPADAKQDRYVPAALVITQASNSLPLTDTR